MDEVTSKCGSNEKCLPQLSLDELKKLLSQNGYPRGVVNYNMNDVLQKQQNKPLTPTITCCMWIEFQSIST